MVIKATRGITVIEMMVTVAIMGIIFAIAIHYIPEMFIKMRVNAAAREIARELQLARIRAVKERTVRYGLYFNPPYQVVIFRDTDMDNNYSAGDDVIRTINFQGKFKGIKIGALTNITSIQGGSIEGDGVNFANNTVIFKNTGSPATISNINDDSVYLIPEVDILSERKTRMRAVNVNIYSGNIKVWEYDPYSATQGHGPWK